MLPIAAKDLEDIADDLARFYDTTAVQQYDRIVEKIHELAEFPEMYEVQCSKSLDTHRSI